ncbi:glycoside hydrolase superfamily [Xylariaceae sp. FL0804]|nr:glycoside hydrolase superfamily [Xylariaceae sp. FL0804]
MKLSCIFATGLALNSSAVLAATAWAGSNLYYAAGLSTSEQETLFSGLQGIGAKVLRVWLDGQTSPQKGTTFTSFPSLETDSPGDWDDTVLNLLDDVMVKAHDYGIKLQISIYSYNSLEANNDFYGQWYGTGDFYTDSNAITYFQNRINHVLSHVNPNSGKTWAESSEYIFGFEAQNEADQPNNNPTSTATWQCTMAGTLKSAIGSDAILVMTGGGGWVDSSTPAALFSCADLDVVSIHAYGAGDLTAAKLDPKVTLATDSGKKLLLQEWGACYYAAPDGNNNCPGSGDVEASATRDADIAEWAGAIAGAGIPWLYWQVLPNADPHGETWDYEVGIGDVQWSALSAAAEDAPNHSSPFDYSDWLL